jgi:hypothetical protein
MSRVSASERDGSQPPGDAIAEIAAVGPKKNRGLFGKATLIRASPDPFADLQKYDDQVQREQRIDVQQQPEQRAGR